MKIFTWTQRWVVYAVTLACVAGFAFIGWGIGVLVQQTRLGILLAVLVSYPFTQWMLVKQIRRLHKKNES